MNTIRNLDLKLSRKVHNSNLGAFEVFLLPWGYLFQPPFVWVAPTMFGLGWLFHDKIYESHVRWLWLWSMVGLYIVAMIVNLYFTTKVKRSIGWIRPFLNNTQRLANLWGMESNCAMPSGDTSQAAMMAAMIGLHLHNPYFIVCVPLVMIARVYYQCHWFGDTITGTCMGVNIAFWTWVLVKIISLI